MKPATIIACELSGPVDPRGFPLEASWNLAEPVRFDYDWRGKNEDAERETEVRVLWTEKVLYLKFRCRYRTLTVFEDCEPNGRRDQLWDRDVAEVFIQTDASPVRRYWEFEISPNGMWIDLEFSPAGKRDPVSATKPRDVLDVVVKVGTDGLALRRCPLTMSFNPSVH